MSKLGYTILRCLNLFVFLLSLTGVAFGLWCVIEGGLPCSGDGCITHIFLIIGLSVLAIFGPIFYITGKEERTRFLIWKERRKSGKVPIE